MQQRFPKLAGSMLDLVTEHVVDGIDRYSSTSSANIASSASSNMSMGVWDDCEHALQLAPFGVVAAVEPSNSSMVLQMQMDLFGDSVLRKVGVVG